MQQYNVQTGSQAQAQYSPRQLLESARRAEADGNVDLAAHVSRYVLEHFPGSPESAEAYNSLVRLGQPPIEQTIALAPQASLAPPPMQVTYAPQPAPMSTAAPARFNGTPPQGPPAAAWAPPPPQGTPSHVGGQPAYAAPSPARAHATVQQAPVNGAMAYGAQMQTPVQTIAATFAPAQPYRAPETGNANPQAMIHHAPEVTPQYRGGRFVARLAFVAGGLMILAGLLTPVPALMGIIGAQPSLIGTGLVACALIATGLLALLGGQTALAVFDQADNMRALVELERTRWNA